MANDVNPLPPADEVIPYAIVRAVIEKWPDQAVEILKDIRPARDHWYFHRWGMYVGVEYDGYIHT